MHKPKPYKCPVCGAELPDLPMLVLKHQMSHVRRKPFAGIREKPVKPGRALPAQSLLLHELTDQLMQSTQGQGFIDEQPDARLVQRGLPNPSRTPP